MDPTVGQPHGQTSPIRWDPSVASGLLVLAALAFLIFINFAFGGSVSGSARISRR